MDKKKGKKHTEETKHKISKANSNPSKETRKKMSDSWKSGNRVSGMKGKPHSEATKRKLSETLRGKKRSNETKHKMVESWIQRKKNGIVGGMKGKHHTKEAKIKISEASRGNTHWLGRKHTLKAKRKMSVAKKGKKSSVETKRKLCLIRAKRIIPLKDSSIEVKVQEELKKLNIPFEKHRYIYNIKHKYCCDIFIEPNIIIECDGDYWHSIEQRPEQAIKDSLRTIEMTIKGYIVLRFWEHEIKIDIDNVMNTITENI